MTGQTKNFFDRERALRRTLRSVRISAKVSGARIYRRFRSFEQVVAVTGSVAKSTVTALVGEILQQSGRVHLGYGQNTFGGIAGGFWRSPAGARFWVQEISGHAPGVIEPAAAFICPTIAIITTVQMDHFKSFEDEDHIAAEKSRILDALPQNGHAILNADDPRVLAMGERCKGRKIITFGRSKDADIRLVSLSQGLPAGLSIEITDGKNTVCIKTRFTGSRWALAILAAIAGARAAGIDLGDCKSAIENHKQEFTKDSIHHLPDGTTFVLDCWKASLSTIPTSIEIMKHARAVRKTMIVGTISDYRGSSGSKYRNTARAALGCADKVIFYGTNSDRVQRLIKDFPDRLYLFHHIQELRAHLLQNAVPGEIVYIKSAGVDRLERLLLDRLEPISCWLEKCGRKSTCVNCKFLYGTRGRAKRVLRDFQL